MFYKYETDYPNLYPEGDPNRLVGIIDRADVEGFKEQGFNQNGITNAQINNSRENHYTYDGAGRMTGDPFKGLTILYNHLDLPRSITGPEGTILITYDATGRKWLQKTVASASTADEKSRIYAGALEFVKSEDTGNEYKLEAANTGDGRLILDEDANDGAGQIYPEYHHKDHLGNTRVAFTDRNENGRVELLGVDAEVTQQLDYYPFGLQHEGEGLFHEPGTPINRMQYNGKEVLEEVGLYAYGFRYYDPVIGRFTGMDPISDQFPHVSTYNYAENEPIANIDLHGLQKVSAFIVGSIVTKNDDGRESFSPIELAISIDIGNNSASTIAAHVGSFSTFIEIDNQGEKSVSFPPKELATSLASAGFQVTEYAKEGIWDELVQLGIGIAAADQLSSISSENTSEENMIHLISASVLVKMNEMIISDMVDVGSIVPRDLPALGLSGAFGIGGVSLGINEKGETNMNKLGFTYTVTTSSGTVEMEIGRQTLLRFIAAITYTQQNCLDGCD